PANPSSPPKFVTWGEGSKDEMYYLPFLFVPYKSGDENVVFEDNTSSVFTPENTALKTSLSPNPISKNSTFPAHLRFELHTGGPVTVEMFAANGQLLRNFAKNEYFPAGKNILHIEPAHLS